MPDGHKGPLKPVAINAIVSQLVRALPLVPISLCLNPMCVFFFKYIIIIIIK